LLLIPAYNEEARIEPVLREYGDFFRRNYHGEFKLVVILNGCRDNTLGKVQEAAKDFPAISWLDFPGAIGKGGALIEGLKLAFHADLIGYVDADGATGPEAVLKLLPLLQNADCIAGSRWLPESVLLQKQPGFRRFISRCFHFVVELLFWMHIKDTQCPCKLMRREAAERIQGDLHIADLAFDVNLLVAMKRHGCKVVEAPVEWTDKIGSTVTASLFRSSMTMLMSVIRLRLVYSPFRPFLRWLKPVEATLYRKLRQPPPRSAKNPDESDKKKSEASDEKNNPK
jgi:glycosyltransferase involved in cell wall biosynthesis